MELLTFLSAHQRAELVVHSKADLSDKLRLHLLDHVEIGHVVHMFVVRGGGDLP